MNKHWMEPDLAAPHRYLPGTEDASRIEHSIFCGNGGWRVEWFDRETEQVAVWWAGPTGGKAECEERAKQPPPATGWKPLSEDSPSDVIRD